ncbi:MAG: succinylglutamate-semialdehyde dehydrogenase [Zymomonas mobilis]|uniref:succinylglutamate-semialdehyde dehydrogenase n=1 Tax=Zymomonas mobilis TaxID=542 RepID=UPI0001B703A0|nr:succinylglutamate-semialdehyde dehydrogenase [Zymomonas mobilis]ACV74622.1 succinylglutamic semialdehyde dehydrogenase [Zymomonas mobilis subsp. mobilis NCIMB 11163]
MSEMIISTDPVTGQILWQGSVGDVDQAVSRARSVLSGWAKTALEDRIVILERFAAIIREKADIFGSIIARETGKPFWEAKTESQIVANKVDISVLAYKDRSYPVALPDIAPNIKSGISYKPHGVLVVLGPFNFPAHLPNGHIVPALIAGNVIIFKPSEKTPASGEFLVQCYHEAGVPKEVVQLLIGGRTEGEALSRHNGIDGLLFTGSSQGGVALSRVFAENPGRILALEMGGNNPLVIWNSEDIESAAAIAVQSAYLSAGQRCTCARRLIVEDGKHQPLLDAIQRLIGRLIIDQPFADPQPFMGSVIDNAAADHAEKAYNDLVANGAKILHPLQRLEQGKPFLTPALLDMTDCADKVDEEIFAPVLKVIRVSDFEAAIKEANNTRFGLSAALVDDSPEDFMRFRDEVRAGVINWNRPTNGAPSTAPFGGVGLSGNHRPSAYFAADYCAYPVTSTEALKPDTRITVGLK